MAVAVGDHSDEAFCYITTRGRRTGRSHTIEIWFAAARGVVYVMGDGHGRSDWMRNLRADARASVRVGPERFDATARFLERGSAEDSEARRLLLQKYQRGDDLEGWGRTALAVAFDLQSSSAGR